MNTVIKTSLERRFCRSAFIRSVFALGCFAFSPITHAVNPPPDGGYPGFTTAEGQNALFSLTTGSANTAVGWFSLWGNAAGSFNTATGAGSLLFNSADANAAFGAAALLFNSTGINNTAVGAAALLNNTIAEENTATGAFALSSNTEGDFNTANGAWALYFNTTGERNTAMGDSALYSNSTGNRNTAIGNPALLANTTGDDNTATGFDALRNNTIGVSNTANGVNALYSNTIGVFNTANGESALRRNTTGSQNTANGVSALYNNTTGNSNTAIGDGAGQNITGDRNVCIGFAVYGTAGVNDTTWIRNVYSSVANGRAVYVNSDDKIGTLSSSRRYKDEIRPMAKTSEAILCLRPVRFRYKKEVDPSRSLSFGLIAEEVAQVAPELVTLDRGGKPETVRYEAVNAMLLNEFLKEHRKVEEQEATIAQLTNDLQRMNAQQQEEARILRAQLADQAVQIQKISARIATRIPAEQVTLSER